MFLYMISSLITLYKANAFSFFNRNIPINNFQTFTTNCQPMNFNEVTAMSASWPSSEHHGEIICHIELRGSEVPLCCCYITWQGQSAVNNIAGGLHSSITGNMILLKNCSIISSDYQPDRNWTYSLPNIVKPNGQITTPGTQHQNANKNGKIEHFDAVTSSASNGINRNSKGNLFYDGKAIWIYNVFNALLFGLILNVIRTYSL